VNIPAATKGVQMAIKLKRKIFYPVSEDLRAYLKAHAREQTLPVRYEQLLNYENKYPLLDIQQNDTLWECPIYDSQTQEDLNKSLVKTYIHLKAGETEMAMAQHLRVDRIDYCAFGNSCPFRIRVKNQFNDNYDYYYIKRSDSSRIYGLALEHALSPNAMNYLVNEGTLVEEHIAGIPGDDYIKRYTDHPGLNQVRLAKEFVKFNERCFARLLGDMRSYNYIVDMTPDFEEMQYRVRAIDFDQQSYEGRRSFYQPQFFKDNNPIVEMCIQSLNHQSMEQYQIEERTLIRRRFYSSRHNLKDLMAIMRKDTLSTEENVHQLRTELMEFHNDRKFLECRTMGDLVLYNLSAVLEDPDILNLNKFD
jgi:hypothetical protein